MKFKNTLILFGVFIVLLAGVLLFESKGKKSAAEKEKKEKLVDLASADIIKMTLKNKDGALTFTRDDTGHWRITEPLDTRADDTEVNSLAEDFADLKTERIVEAEPKDLGTYGIPAKELALWVKGKDQPVNILIGMENPLDQTLFAKREDEKKVVLLPGSLKTSLDKKLLDFRQKDIFKFETSEVAAIKLLARDVAWEASKKNEKWMLKSPLRALARTNKIESLLTSLSGLKAKEFISENKTDDEMIKNGLDRPEYKVVMFFPSSDTEAVLMLHKDGDNLYAAGSLSNKIIKVDPSILTDLEKESGEYREKKVAVFYSWDVDRISIKKNGLDLAAIKEKVKDEEKWRLETPEKSEADGSKIETFIRKIEGLEAAEFIDSPGELAEYGLDKPEAEIKVRIKEGDGKTQEILILIGREDKDKKQIVVKNAELDYLFKADSFFLKDFPKETKDWKAEIEKETAENKTKK